MFSSNKTWTALSHQTAGLITHNPTAQPLPPHSWVLYCNWVCVLNVGGANEWRSVIGQCGPDHNNVTGEANDSVIFSRASHVFDLSLIILLFCMIKIVFLIQGLFYLTPFLKSPAHFPRYRKWLSGVIAALALCSFFTNPTVLTRSVTQTNECFWFCRIAGWKKFSRTSRHVTAEKMKTFHKRWRDFHW